jgi:hypothetical protein
MEFIPAEAVFFAFLWLWAHPDVPIIRKDIIKIAFFIL